MKEKRFLGFVFVLTGLLLMLSRIVITGAVIGATSASLLGLIGALLFILGFVLIIRHN